MFILNHLLSNHLEKEEVHMQVIPNHLLMYAIVYASFGSKITLQEMIAVILLPYLVTLFPCIGLDKLKRLYRSSLGSCTFISSRKR